MLGVPSLERVLAACRTALGPDAVTVHAAPSGGPLGAVVEAFAAAPDRALIILACDLPFIDPGTVARLAALVPTAEVDAWVPVVDGRAQPLAARYEPRAATGLRAAWEAGDRSIVKALSRLRVATITDLGGPALADFDTEADLARLVAAASQPDEEHLEPVAHDQEVGADAPVFEGGQHEGEARLAAGDDRHDPGDARK